MNAIFLLFLSLTAFSALFIVIVAEQQQEAKSVEYYNQTSAKPDTNLSTNPEKTKAYNQSNISIRLEDALNLYNAALTIQPNATDILSNKGMVLIKLQRYGEANDVFDRILTIDPSNVAGLYNKGVTLEKAGKADDANKFYNMALKINPHYHPELINRLSLALSIDKAEPLVIEPSNINNKSFNIKNET
jgi:tetratricopeptide (TPR) repeat protein